MYSLQSYMLLIVYAWYYNRSYSDSHYARKLEYTFPSIENATHSNNMATGYKCFSNKSTMRDATIKLI